ncbi:hypothetical protein FHX42_001128 [Saccharopolyspora lacisalsi]|uniref:Secreted protein/lipoprotein n=1 Tax=Halosaccharopolyspora lacisalsi TaxID=1000566 RepID=A0A839DSS6_9PSEU|nr:hypothetical protein [Halosaccharopolyspora lacisalsi]MBA8823799.1 hypothetical protein [Halosaccharopolyspora lacisalsi]
MWQAMTRAGHTSNWKSPELGRYAAGNALTTITRSLYADHFNDVVTRGAPENHPEVTSVAPPKAPTKVMIEDCGDSSDTLKYYEGTDKPVNDTPGGRRLITAEVKKQSDGSWKVTRFAVRGLDSC